VEQGTRVYPGSAPHNGGKSLRPACIVLTVYIDYKGRLAGSSSRLLDLSCRQVFRSCFPPSHPPQGLTFIYIGRGPWAYKSPGRVTQRNRPWFQLPSLTEQVILWRLTSLGPRIASCLLGLGLGPSGKLPHGLVFMSCLPLGSSGNPPCGLVFVFWPNL